MKFEQRRKSIEEGEDFTRTLSVLDKEINQLKDYTEKIDTLDIKDLHT